MTTMDAVPRSEIVARYLDALDLSPRSPDLDFLTELIRRHVATFTFSSVGCRLGDDLPLDLPSLFDRIATRRRGGYCFEQNGLFFEVLAELGFSVELCLARVIYNQDIHPGLTHRNTIVDLPDGRFVADVGFGGDGPRVPVPLTGEETGDNDRTYRLEEPRAGEFHLQILKDKGFFSLYRFELARYGQADCELGHFYSHRHPEAVFVNNLVAMRILEHEVRSLRNLDYGVFDGPEERWRTVKDAEELGTILADEFDLRVTPVEVRRLFEELI